MWVHFYLSFYPSYDYYFPAEISVSQWSAIPDPTGVLHTVCAHITFLKLELFLFPKHIWQWAFYMKDYGPVSLKEKCMHLQNKLLKDWSTHLIFSYI